MTPSRLFHATRSQASRREALLGRLGTVNAGLFLLATLPDDESKPPQGEPAAPDKEAPVSSTDANGKKPSRPALL